MNGVLWFPYDQAREMKLADDLSRSTDFSEMAFVFDQVEMWNLLSFEYLL
jgi:hypothetical protein